MNKETYEALKRIIDFTRGKSKELKNNDINQIEEWIDEVAKEYTEEKAEIIGQKCSICGASAFEEDNGWKTSEGCSHFPNMGE